MALHGIMLSYLSHLQESPATFFVCGVSVPRVSDMKRHSDMWELLPSDIVVGNLLGEGAFGEVYEGVLTRRIRNNKIKHYYKNAATTIVAVKILKGMNNHDHALVH